jgi:hypothetical protein
MDLFGLRTNQKLAKKSRLRNTRDLEPVVVAYTEDTQ